MSTLGSLACLADFSAGSATKDLTGTRDDDRRICIISRVGHRMLQVIDNCGWGEGEERGISISAKQTHSVMYHAPDGDMFMLSDRRKTVRSFDGSLLFEASSTSSSSFSRSLIVSCGPAFA